MNTIPGARTTSVKQVGYYCWEEGGAWGAESVSGIESSHFGGLTHSRSEEEIRGVKTEQSNKALSKLNAHRLSHIYASGKAYASPTPHLLIKDGDVLATILTIIDAVMTYDIYDVHKHAERTRQ